MESSVQRRLDCVSRHLLLPPEVNSLAFTRLDYLTGIHFHFSLTILLLFCSECTLFDAILCSSFLVVVDELSKMESSVTPCNAYESAVQYALGGVARNIAECMSKLGTKSYMISAVGIDIAGSMLLEYWNSAGLSTEGIRKHQNIRTAVICNIFDTSGELMAAVANVEAVEKFLTPEWILQSKCNISSASVLLVDANLTPPALEASCQVAAEYNIPVWFEPVSVAKSMRITSIVNNVTFASPNEDELIAMANALSCGNTFHPVEKDNCRKCSTESLFQMLKPAILVLLEKGIKIVVVTLGADGVFLCSKEPNFMRSSLERTKRYGFNGWLYDIVASSCPSNKFFGAMQGQGSSHLFAVHFPALPASVVRLTGAGDCLVGGTLASLCEGLDIMQSVAVGMAVAKHTVEAETNVPSSFSLASIAALFIGYVKLQQCESVFELSNEFRAKELIVPDALILVSLLWACALQAAFSPGKKTHAEGNWAEMGRIGKQMRGKEAKGVHIFTSGDRTHRKADSMYSMLACLNAEIHEVSVVLCSEDNVLNVDVQTEIQLVCNCFSARLIPTLSSVQHAYGTFSVAEVFADKILSWFPLYYHMKFAFLVWLQLPSVNGARQLYMNHLRPFLLRHQARFDQMIEFLHREVEKFVITHQAEFKFAKALFVKAVVSVHHMVQDIIHPGQRQANGAFRGRARRIQDSQSDDED
ncbi:hypothetical protein GH714_008653 [Hevea brasiliensis]|uniref:Carbohydrate kinase PfkB domain-containing protein n=1 Tax=Hevea brasiliensis TaxID=3981 RepID=A0A6A6M0P5_HEVBR|nr:hypothetical protein GH714_008653 [Hevea brasiliensis]